MISERKSEANYNKRAKFKKRIPFNHYYDLVYHLHSNHKEIHQGDCHFRDRVLISPNLHKSIHILNESLLYPKK